MSFEQDYQKPYEFLQESNMTRNEFLDMVTAICVAHRDMFSEFVDDALDGNGALKEYYCYGTSHVIACMIAQRTGKGVESEVPMSELLLCRVKSIPYGEQREMVECLLKSFE